MDKNDQIKIDLNPFQKQQTKGISIFTALKNRTETFQEALKTWIVQEFIDEIIIVDWGSDESIISLINNYQNGKILLAVIPEQPKWILSHAFNLAARLTTRHNILKIDADVKILPGFFEKHPLENGSFYAGNWRKARDENEQRLNGTLYIKREDFFSVNGFNEFIKSYGWDDTDLHQRLVNEGLKRYDFDFDTLYHIPHEDRTTFQDEKDFLRLVDDLEKSNLNILINKHITSNACKWSSINKMLDFSVEVIRDNLITCTQSHEDRNILPEGLIQMCTSYAIKERLEQLRCNFAEAIMDQFDEDELKALYLLCYRKNSADTEKQIFNLFRKFNNAYLQGFENSKVSDLTNRLNEKDQQISLISQRLDEIHDSYSWRLGHFIISVISRLLFWKKYNHK